MSPFVKGILITGGAPTLISLVSIVGVGVAVDSLGFALLWLLAPIAFIVCLIVGLVSSVFRTRAGKAGVLAGIGLSIVAMGTTCFAM